MAAIALLGMTRAQLAVAGALIVVTGLSGALVALEWAPADEVRSAVAPQPPAAEAGKIAPPAQRFSLPSLASFSGVTDRPLFAPDRRPTPDVGEALGSWSALVVAGIVVTPDTRTVLIAHGNPPKLVHLQEGQAVDGWVVRAIDADHVVVANGGEEHELRFLAKREGESSSRSAQPRSAR